MRRPDGTYLVVEVASFKSPGIDFTAAHPSCVVDMALARRPGAGAEPTMDAILLVRGAGNDLPRFIDILRAHYGAVVTLEQRGQNDAWLDSFRIPLQGLANPDMREVGRFLLGHGLDLQWIRGEQGRVFIRCPVQEGADANRLADQLRGYLEALHVDADVAVETSSPGNSGPWQELVDRIRFHAARHS